METKTFFTEGLEKIRKQVEARFYTSALAFAVDLCTVIRKGIEAAPAIQAAPVKEEAIRDLDSLAKQDKLDIKERQKFARKIIKAVRPQLEAAVEAEADITNKSAEVLLKELESLFESSLETRPESTTGSLGDGLIVVSTAINGFGEKVDTTAEVVAAEVISNAVLSDGDAMVVETSIAVQEENTEPTLGNIETEKDVADNINGSTTTLNTELKPPVITNGGGATPPDTNGYISEPSSHIQPAPPTPPLSNSDPSTNPDTQNILRGGGIPWYLEAFKPEGTTIGEEQWSGRDIVRSMSEELSEIDDEELKGLMGSDVMDLDMDIGMSVSGDVGVLQVAAVATAAATPKTTKKGKKKKAWRGFK